MARTPTRTPAPTRAVQSIQRTAAPTKAAPAQAANADVMRRMAEVAIANAGAQTPARVVAQPQTQPLPPSAGRLTPAQMPASAGRAVPPMPVRGLGAAQQAAAASRMPAKLGSMPLPSGMGMGGGQPTPPSRTGGGMPTMAGGPGGMKKGGKVKKMAKGGSVSSASKRGDGCATKGKTKGRFV